MVIHHDKLAYGRLASPSEEMTEEQIAQMLKQLNEEEKETSDGENENSPQKDK